jgi:hypothetical protein
MYDECRVIITKRIVTKKKKTYKETKLLPRLKFTDELQIEKKKILGFTELIWDPQSTVALWGSEYSFRGLSLFAKKKKKGQKHIFTLYFMIH